MTRTLASLCLAALALGPAGCLGDDPDHIPTTGYGGGVTKGGGQLPINIPGTTVLRTELMAQLDVGYARAAPDRIAAPELCGDCDVTIDRSVLGSIVDLTVRDDGDHELCRVTGNSWRLVTDTCGLFSAD